MAAEDRIRWDEIFKRAANKPFPAPDPFLFEYTPPVPPDGTHFALDLAAGLGQNGLWLAEQGYTVDIMDISRVALNRAREEMSKRGLRNVNLIPVDLDDFELDAYRYDLVCVFRYLKRDALPVIRGAIKPGGRIIYETFNLNYIKHVPGFNMKFLLQPDELVENFPGWEFIVDREEEHITRMVAVRPDNNNTQPVPIFAKPTTQSNRPKPAVSPPAPKPDPTPEPESESDKWDW